MTQDYHDPKHEEKSDVASFIGDVKRFWEKFGLVLLVLLLAVLIGVILKQRLVGRQDRMREEAYAMLAAASSPFAMKDVADQYEHVPGFAGFARLQAADRYVREALGLLLVPGRDAQVTPEQRERGLKDAAELFQRVIDQSDSSLQVATAQLSLASVFESMSKFELAEELYRKVSDSKDWPMLAVRARARLESIGEIKSPVYFPPPSPKPVEPAPTAEPAKEGEKPAEPVPAAEPAPQAEAAPEATATPETAP